MHAVVGLCGNEKIATRGFGQADSQASTRSAKKASPGVGLVVAETLEAHHADVRAGEERRVEVNRVGGRRDERRVAGSDDDPHEVGKPLLGPDRRHHLAIGVQLARRTASGRGPQMACRSLGIPRLAE